MKEQSKIPTSKVKRAAKLIGTGAKVGGNYIKYYANKAIGDKNAKDKLDKDNAEDIYQSLSELKGSALKMAQVMSMDKSMLPKAMTDKFAQAQYNAPPLSYPLVVKTFRQMFGKTPTELFDSFEKEAKHAASIGQVHLAILGNLKLAVKVQYPGVADSVKSDLKLVKPIAMQMLHMKEKEIKQYMQEIEGKLLEESGENDDDNNYKYDNLPDYKYVNVQYDTFTYVRKTPKAAAKKVKVGYKICRFAEHKTQGKAVIPSVLQELLISRKQTKKLCKNEPDPFMKNVYDNRQLAIKLTTNSLYGQTGAKTSQFY